MQRLLIQAFKGIQFTDRQKKVLDRVYVTSMNASRKDKTLTIVTGCDHLVPRREFAIVEKQLDRSLENTGFKAVIEDHYTLSDTYTPAFFWNEYKDSVLFILKGISRLDFSFCLEGNTEIQGNNLVINGKDLKVYRERKSSLISEIQDIFKSKAGFDINVTVNYSIKSEEKDPVSENVVYMKRPSGSAVSAENREASERKGTGTENKSKAASSDEDKKSAFQRTGTAKSGENSVSEVRNQDGSAALSADMEAAEAARLAMAGESGQGRAADPAALNNKGMNSSQAGNTSGNGRVNGRGNAGGRENRFEGRRYGDRRRGFFRKRAGENVDEDCIFGFNTDGDTVKLVDIEEENHECVIEGMVLSSEEITTRNGKIILTFNITDFTDSITCKLFLDEDEADGLRPHIKKNAFLRVRGLPVYDKYSSEITFSSIRGIKETKDFRTQRLDTYSGPKRVELHAHTQMSEMDSVMDVVKYIERARKWGHKACAITDHGQVQAFPDAYNSVKSKGDLKLLYGVEAYLVDDLIRIVRDPEGQSLDSPFVVFDLETTGIGVRTHKIIEIGAVKLVNNEIADRFSTFVNPGEPIPYEITRLTSITDKDVAGYPGIEVILPKFLDFCRGCTLVAHNAGFDYGFIKYYAKKVLGRDINFTVVDTVGLSRVLLKNIRKYTLDRVAKELNVVLNDHHRAVNDAECTAGIYMKLVDMAKEKGKSTVDGLNEMQVNDVNSIRKLRPNHAIILAKNETGRVALYRLVSESHVKYFNRRPLVPKSLVQKYREGLILGSACSRGELYEAVLEEKSDEEIDRIVKFYDYLEIQPLGNNRYMLNDKHYPQIQDENDLAAVNKKIVALGEMYHKPVCATCDVHFLDPEDEVYRRIMLAAKKIPGADTQPPIFFRTTDEMLKEFSYLGQEKAFEVVVTNTNLIADMIDDIPPLSPRKCPPEIENSDKTLEEICYRRAHEIYGPELPPVVDARLKRELGSIISNGYAVMYIIAQKLVWKSNEDGYLVGSRGSVGSSFVANMSGITEVNSLAAHYYCPKCHYYDFDSPEVKKYAGYSAYDMPDKDCPRCGTKLKKDGHDIPFETFLGFKGNKEPDIDLNFSSEYQSNAHDYTEVIFGAGQTFKAGTVSGIQDKTAYGYVLKYCEERNIVKRRAEMERLASGMVGTRRTTGQHPGGIVVLPVGEDINTFTPVQHPADDPNSTVVTTHFDYHKIDSNLLKLDILGHQDPTMIRELSDLTGVDASKIPFDDKEVLSLFESTEALGITPEDIGGCKLGCLGLPEFGTHFVIGMLQEAKPKNFSDLVRISGLSHGTDVWLNNAQYYISTGQCTLSTAICTRDDIMTYLIGKGIENETAFNIMERVRKGKVASGKCEEWPGWVKIMKEHDVPDWYIESCQKIKYMFPKAHAVAYVMMALRVAWFKVHKPLAYYSAYFSIRATAFSYELMAMGKEKLAYHIADYRKRENELSDQEKNQLENMKIVEEMYARGFDFTPVDIYKAHANRFQICDGKLMPSFLSIDGLGDKAAEMFEAEAEKKKFLSLDDIKNRVHVPQAVLDKMEQWGLLEGIPHSNQISLTDFMGTLN